MTQKLVFKNYQLESLYSIMFNLTLKGGDSRLRTRFVQLLESRLQLIESERQTIFMQYAKKDDKGELVTEEVEGKVGYVMDDKAQYLLEYRELKEEDFVIEVNVENVDMIKSVTTSLLNADIELSGNDAIIYDNFCLIFENVDFEAVK